jgi:hypothetical protein
MIHGPIGHHVTGTVAVGLADHTRLAARSIASVAGHQPLSYSRHFVRGGSLDLPGMHCFAPCTLSPVLAHMCRRHTPEVGPLRKAGDECWARQEGAGQPQLGYEQQQNSSEEEMIACQPCPTWLLASHYPDRRHHIDRPRWRDTWDLPPRPFWLSSPLGYSGDPPRPLQIPQPRETRSGRVSLEELGCNPQSPWIHES